MTAKDSLRVLPDRGLIFYLLVIVQTIEPLIRNMRLSTAP